MNAILAVTAPEHISDGVDRSPLEADFDKNWPDAVQYLPAAADDAAPIPNEQFAPNPARAEIFDGYTFVFYEKKQFDFLMAPITTGKGKALLYEVVPQDTQVDDFIRYVKGVAGEKGLGEFEDGSEGKGVVVVQFMPSNQEHLEWYTQFYTSVSLRLDQRLITQKDFLPAILSNDASGLRRQLEEETEEHTRGGNQSTTAPGAMDVDSNPPAASSQPLLRRRQRGAAKSRFRGFGITLDDEDEQPTEAPALPAPTPSAAEPEPSQEGLFVSQPVDSQALEVPIRNTRQSQRKRPAPAVSDPQEILDGFAPTAAQAKRRRIAAGEDPLPREATPTPPPPPAEPAQQQKPVATTPKIKKEMDVLDLARQHREEVEARDKAEREELATAPEGLDLAEIRRLQIQEPIALRQLPPARSREQDIADGRWDPAWNGRKNFKKFQKRGAVQGRPPQRIIVSLEAVKAKGYGISDDYWLEDSHSSAQGMRNSKKTAATPSSRSQSKSQNQSHARTTRDRSTTPALGSGLGSARTQNSSKRVVGLAPVDSSEEQQEDAEDTDMMVDDNSHNRQAVEGDDDDDDDDDDVIVSTSRTTRSTRASTTQPSQPSTQRDRARSSRATTTAAAGKRAAPAPPPAREKPAKRPKVIAIRDSDEEESEDELRFRFGRR